MSLVWMLQLAVKGTLVLAAAFVAASLLRRSSAAARHFAWLAGLVTLLALPFFAAALPSWSPPGLAAWLPDGLLSGPEGATVRIWIAPTSAANAAAGIAAIEEQAAAGRAVSEPRHPAPEALGLAQREPLAGTRRSGAQLEAALGAIWLAGFAVVLFWLGAGLTYRARLTRSAEETANGQTAQMARRVARELDLSRPVRLLEGSTGRAAKTVPMTWGLRRPVLLFPSAARTWPESRLRTVLFHELAHVRRWDSLTRTLAQLACATFWFHPLAWYSARRLLHEQERACDDIVLMTGADPHHYAATLVAIAREFRAPRPAVVGALAIVRRSNLEHRLLSILDPLRRRQKMTLARRVMLISVFMVAVLPLAALRPSVAPIPETAVEALQVNQEDGPTQSAASKPTQDRRKVAIASSSSALGEASVAIGQASIAVGEASAAIGQASIAVGETSAAVGQASVAVGETSAAVGQVSIAVGKVSAAVGEASAGIGQASIAVGESSAAVGEASVAVGQASVAVGETSVAVGQASIALGEALDESADGLGAALAQQGSIVVRIRGAVRVGGTIDSIELEDNGSLRILQDDRELEVLPRNGELEITYLIDGTERPLDDEARAWANEILAYLARSGPRRGNISMVLSESDLREPEASPEPGVEIEPEVVTVGPTILRVEPALVEPRAVVTVEPELRLSAPVVIRLQERTLTEPVLFLAGQVRLTKDIHTVVRLQEVTTRAGLNVSLIPSLAARPNAVLQAEIAPITIVLKEPEELQMPVRWTLSSGDTEFLIVSPMISATEPSSIIVETIEPLVDDEGRGRRFDKVITWSDEQARYVAMWRGDVQLSDRLDEMRLEANAELVIDERRTDGTHRRLHVTGENDSAPTFELFVDGDARPFDEAARAWLEGILEWLTEHDPGALETPEDIEGHVTVTGNMMLVKGSASATER